jgi:hypothetical protein
MRAGCKFEGISDALPLSEKNTMKLDEVSYMSKIKANYYYVPICTESFATLDRLTMLFSTIQDEVEFVSIDISKHELTIFL